ncbi:MAG: MerR family transcriptional regulator [bacterium]|jgi:DNA-binding transcriptional MerR regulator
MRLRQTSTARLVPISVASEITGVEVHTLRYWEKEFNEFFDPVRTTGGQRRYRPDDIEAVLCIKRLLKDEMYSIAGARRALRARKERQVA